MEVPETPAYGEHSNQQQPGLPTVTGNPGQNERQPLLTHSEAPNLAEAVSGKASPSTNPGVAVIQHPWSKQNLILAYIGITLLSWTLLLEAQTTVNLTIFATSAFRAHSLIATVNVVRGTIMAALKLPMAHMADCFGRLGAFSVALTLYAVGYALEAAASSIGMYTAAQLFSSSALTGLQVLILIFIADTSSMANRALCSTIPRLPFLVTPWLGPSLADLLLRRLSWRWGYGIWVLIVPVTFVPLAIALGMHRREAARHGSVRKSPFSDKTWWGLIESMCLEFDLGGILLLALALSLLLVPATLAARYHVSTSVLIITTLAGLACLLVLPFWESSQQLAPRPFFPRAFSKNRTLLAGLIVTFCLYASTFLSIFTYLQSYLLVVHSFSLPKAGRITQVSAFVSTAMALPAALLIRWSKRYRGWLILGTVLYVAGLISMVKYCVEASTTASLVATQVFMGVGSSFVGVPVALAIQAAAGPAEVAAATALSLSFVDIGMSAGSALSGALWSSTLPVKLEAYLPKETKAMAMEIYGNITLASTGWGEGTPTRIAINHAYQETLTKILGVSVCVALPCLVFALTMHPYRLDQMDSVSVDNHTDSSAVVGGLEQHQHSNIVAASS